MTEDAIVYATDIHLTDRQPSNRVTSVDNGITLFRNLLQLTRDNGRVLVLGGDLFDSPAPSYSLLTQVINCLTEYSDCKVYICVGNHDVSYANLDTPVGITALHAAGLLSYFSEGVAVNGFFIKAFDYTPTLKLADNGNLDLRVSTNLPKDATNINTYIAVAHLPIVTEPVPYKHVLTQQIVTDADYVLCGHIHEQFKTFRKSRGSDVTVFLNPGCLLRLKRNEAVIKPSAIVLKRDENVVSHKFVEIQGDENAEFIFDDAKEHVTFTQAVSDAKIEVADIDAYINGTKFPTQVKEKALELIGQYRELQ